MIYITLIFLMAIAVYNLQDYNANNVQVLLFGNKVYFWRLWHSFFFYSTLSAAFFSLFRRSVLAYKRFIYFCGFIFALLYTLFRIVLLTSKDGAQYLGNVNSVLWSTISACIVLVMLIAILIYIKYDKWR